jgi:hypothetical protein
MAALVLPLSVKTCVYIPLCVRASISDYDFQKLKLSSDRRIAVDYLSLTHNHFFGILC